MAVARAAHSATSHFVLATASLNFGGRQTVELCTAGGVSSVVIAALSSSAGAARLITSPLRLLNTHDEGAGRIRVIIWHPPPGGTVDIIREVDGDPILLGTVGAGQFIGEMGVVENRPRSATVRAASEVKVELLTPSEFLDQIAGSPQAARELIQRLSQRLREADDRIVNDERRSGQTQGTPKDADTRTTVASVNNAYLAAKNAWLQRQFHTPLGLGDLPFIVGRGSAAGEGLPRLQPDLKLDDTVPFRLSRNHFMIEKRDGCYYVHDLCSTLGTIVHGEPIGNHFRGDDAALRAGENEVIAGGVDSPFVFSVFIA
jgi:CRP/FNR family transcriptional regulator, cyclic AMP receptor protein